MQPLSPSMFLSPLHPTQHSAAFIQLSHEEILHKRKKLPAPMAKNKTKFSKAGIREKRECTTNAFTKRRVRNRPRSAQSKSSTFVFLPLILFSFAVVLENLHLLLSLCRGIYVPPSHFSHTTHSLPLPSYPPSVCQTSFFPPSQSTQPATPFVGVLV